MKKKVFYILINILLVMSIVILCYYFTNYNKNKLIDTNKEIETKSETINNIVVFINFKDNHNTYYYEYNYINNFFNDSRHNSLKNYYSLMSYNKLNINSYLVGVNSNKKIIPYTTTKDISYYKCYSESNPNGYLPEEKDSIEHELVKEVFESIKNNIPSYLNLDYNNDEFIDAITFIIPGIDEWNEILWAKKGSIENSNIYLDNLQIKDYIIMPVEELQIPTIMYHEFGHILGLKDLYEISDMCESSEVHPYKYSIMYDSYGEFSILDKLSVNWIDDIKEITQSGRYTLYSRSSNKNNGNISYKIPIKGYEDKFFMLEYIKGNESIYSNISKDLLCISGVDNEVEYGNLYGLPYYNYCMTNNENGQTSIIYKDSNNKYFDSFMLSNGEKVNGISIYDIVFSNDTVTFSIEIK